MAEPTDVSEMVEDAEATAEEKNRRERGMRIRGALVVSILAMFLAIASIGGGNAAKTATEQAIAASNTYAFFQAKNQRQQALKLAVDRFEIDLLAAPPEAIAIRAAISAKIDAYTATIARLESEPETGEGKKELLARGKAESQARDHAMRQDPWFDAAEGALQIAIVLVSVSIIIAAAPLFWIGLALGLSGAGLAANGFFLWI